MLAVSCLRTAASLPPPAAVAQPSPAAPDQQRKTFSYHRASPSARWPDLHLQEPEKTLDWISLSNELDARANEDTQNSTHDLDIDPIESYGPPKVTGYTPPINPYIAAHGGNYQSLAAQSSLVAGLIEPKARPRRPNGRLIRLSRLALKKAKDWRERVQRLSAAIDSLEVGNTVADLLKEWHEQLAPTDMCYVLKSVGDFNWRRALELYEWYNVKHWYQPNPRMLAGMLSILGRVHQVSLAREIFDRAETGTSNTVHVYNSMMGVYARQGNCEKVQGLLTLMKEKGCDPDLITYNTVINARCKAGLKPGMAVQILEDMKKDKLVPDVITYNTLISACASRNDCVEAERIFDNMQSSRCEPDLWTYNALISLYGRVPGKEDLAIEFFDVLQRKGLVPDAVTFNSVLYAFAKTGRVDGVDIIRKQMKEAKCRADEITYNTMMSMYGKLGLHEKALSLYHEMRDEGCCPDAVTFTVLIGTLGKAERVSEAENVFQEMSEANVSPTLQTFSAMIHAYAKVGKFDEALSTYECMLQSRIAPDNLAFCLMLDVLQKAKLPNKGFTLYQKAIKRGLVPDLGMYGVLLQWFLQEGLQKEVDMVSNDLIHAGLSYTEVCNVLLNSDLPEKAAQLLESTLDEGLPVNEKLLQNVIQRFCTVAKYDDARVFVGVLSSMAPQILPSVQEFLIASLAEAKQVFAAKDELEKARVSGQSLSLDTYRTLMKLFEDAEMPDQVLSVSSDMWLFGVESDEVCKKCIVVAHRMLDAIDSGGQVPTISETSEGNIIVPLESYISLMESYGKQRLWERAKCVFQELQQAGHRPSLKAWNTLISAFAICGEYENARLAVAEMIAEGKTPTSGTCIAMLQAVINARRPRDIHIVLQEMRQYGVDPGKSIFLDILQSCTSECKVQVAKAVFRELKNAGYFPNMEVYRSLILMLTRVRSWVDAERIMKEMESDGFSPDVIIYNSMITLYGKLGFYRQAADLFAKMQAAGCSPDSFTFNSLIFVFSKCLKIQEAVALVRQMEKAGLSPDVDAYTALISACGRLSMVDAAEALFKDAHRSCSNLNSKVFHAMMNIYRNAGQPEEVKRVLTQMKASAINPTLGTYHVLMDSYGKGGELEQAEAVLDVMLEAGFSAGSLQYAVVVNAYLRSKDHNRAIEKIHSMKEGGFEPDFRIWTTVVAAASHCKESSDAIKLLNALADTGFSLPLRLLTERNPGLVSEFGQVLQKLEQCELQGGLGFTNALLDLLWAFQMHSTAGRIFMIAVEQEVYPSTTARVLVKDWRADLRNLSAGAALIALTLWFDQMQDAALQGFPEAPRFVTVVTGCNRSRSNQISLSQTVKVHLWTMGSPFIQLETRKDHFVAKGYSLCDWLKDSPHCVDMKLRNFAFLPEFNAMELHNGAFMPARLVSALKQIEESIGKLRPKKFQRLIHMTEMRRTECISAELKSREEMRRKGRVNRKRQRKAKFRKKLHKIEQY